MAFFVINGGTTCEQFAKDFNEQFGGVLRIYNGRSEASPDLRPEFHMGAKMGVLYVNPKMTVGEFINIINEFFDLKVKVFTNDDWVAVPSELKLLKVRSIPKQATKQIIEDRINYEKEHGPYLEIRKDRKLIDLKKEFNDEFPGLTLSFNKERDIIFDENTIVDDVDSVTIGQAYPDFKEGMLSLDPYLSPEELENLADEDFNILFIVSAPKLSYEFSKAGELDYGEMLNLINLSIQQLSNENLKNNRIY